MPFCEVSHRPIEWLVNQTPYLNLLVGLAHNCLESVGGKLPESVILIVLADGEVDEVPSYAVEVDVEKVVEELKTVLIDVTLHRFLGQRLCPLQVLN